MPDVRKRPDTNFLSGTAKPGSYTTPLSLLDELKFRLWVMQNKIPFNPEDRRSDYDMRGFWKAFQARDVRAMPQVNPSDGRIHFPDIWKTPYHESFSNESMYARPNAPRWVGADGRGYALVDQLGNILIDERLKK